MADPHRFSVRVYYEDTDAGGIVYHARYLQYCERARTEMLRDCGFDHIGLKERHGLAFTVAAMDMRFRRPARLDDLLTVETAVDAVRPASLTLAQRVVKDGACLYETSVRLALVATEGPELSPKRLPRALLEGVSQLLPCS